jgi:hypothetical protein
LVAPRLGLGGSDKPSAYQWKRQESIFFAAADHMHPQTAESDYRWLVGPEAAKVFAKVAEQFGPDAADALRISNFLHRDLAPERARLVVEQIELRRRAEAKFSQADRMFFTRIGLEQATDQWVADYKAQRFAPGVPLADLCSGIGGDLLALAQHGSAAAVDRDPIAIIFAEANCRAISAELSDAVHFSQIDVSPSVLKEIHAWHIDPDRRPSGKRTTKVEFHEPSPDVLAELLAACPNAAIKLAPAAEFAESWWQSAELEWISRGRECRQLVAWFGSLAVHPGRHRATALRSANHPTDQPAAETLHPTTVHSFVGVPELDPEIGPQVKRFVYEPDPALLAAKLEGDFARQHRLSALAFGVAYFTSDERITNPLVACFEVLEVLPYQTKQLRQWLAARNISRLEIKKRGVPIDPEITRRELKTAGDESATILLCRMSGQVTAIVARRIPV